MLKNVEACSSKEVLEERASKNKRRNVRRKNEQHKKQAIRIMGQRAHKVPQIRKLINETEHYYRLFKILVRLCNAYAPFANRKHYARPNVLSYSDNINIENQKHCISMIDSRRKLLLKITGVREVNRCE
jgi:hypothetical protein